jgi:hypothetical protein
MIDMNLAHQVHQKRPLSLWTGLCLFAMLMVPAVADRLESAMAGQMLVQIPLLILSGYLLGRAVDGYYPSIGQWIDGLPGILLASFTLGFWMLPRSLDAALISMPMEIGKYASLFLLCGLPLGLVWHKLGFVAKAFVRINLLSMLAFLGWVYTASPVRVCNAYLIEQQQLTGRLLLSVCIAYITAHAIRITISGIPRVGSPHSRKSHEVRSSHEQ